MRQIYFYKKNQPRGHFLTVFTFKFFFVNEKHNTIFYSQAILLAFSDPRDPRDFRTNDSQRTLDRREIFAVRMLAAGLWCKWRIV